jgi:protein translocase SecG subunit
MLFKYLQLAVSILLIAAILMQNRGAGLSGIFGGAGNVYLSKRGLEKKLFYATIALAILFFALSILVFFKK